MAHRNVKQYSSGVSNLSLGTGDTGELTMELHGCCKNYMNAFYLPVKMPRWCTSIVKIMERHTESMQMTPAAPDVGCVVMELFCSTRFLSVSFLKSNTTDISLSKMLQKICRKRPSTRHPVVPLHVVWFQGYFLWLPQEWSFLKTKELSFGRARRS